MAKITNMVGLAKGKTGSIVYSVRNGQQIARAYNPYVANPNTPAQVQSRAKLKLLSQVSAAVSPVIAIPRKGAMSARNQFTKVNYKYTGYAANVASLKLADMQLTDSSVGIEGFNADRTSGTAIHCELKADMSLLFDAVVYVVIAKMSSGTLFPFADAVVENAGVGGVFAVDLPYTDGDISVHAYGIKNRTAAARVAFDNLNTRTAAGVASLISNRTISVEDMGLSETRGLYMPQGVNQAETSGVPMYRISIAIKDEQGNVVSDAGTATGAGVFAQDSAYSIGFTPAEGVTFLGWKKNNSSYLVNDNPYSGYVTEDIEFTAVVRMPRQEHTLSLLFTTDSSVNSIQLTGGGQYGPDEVVTISAPAESGSDSFVGWYSDAAGTQSVSFSPSYQLTMPNANLSLYAKYSF